MTKQTIQSLGMWDTDYMMAGLKEQFCSVHLAGLLLSCAVWFDAFELCESHVSKNQI